MMLSKLCSLLCISSFSLLFHLSLVAAQLQMAPRALISDCFRLQDLVDTKGAERAEVIQLASESSAQNLDRLIELKFRNPDKKDLVDTALVVSIFGDSVSHADRVKLNGSGIASSDSALGEVIQKFKEIDFTKFGSVNHDRIDFLILNAEIQDVVQFVKRMKFRQMSALFPGLTSSEVDLLVTKISLFEISAACLAYAPKFQAAELLDRVRPFVDTIGTIMYGVLAKKLYDTGRVLSGHPIIFTIATIFGYPFAAKFWRTFVLGGESARERMTGIAS
jgi:hypothetical protein